MPARQGKPLRARKILILLSTLRAEGTPVLALEIAKVWQRLGLEITIGVFSSEPRDMEEEFLERRIAVYDLNIQNSGYSKFPLLVSRIRELCRYSSPDRVLCFPFGWHTYAAWGARLAGVRTVVAHAGCYPSENSLQLWKLRTTLALGIPLRPVVICCSNHVCDGLSARLGLSRATLRVVQNGIDGCHWEDKTPAVLGMR